jgi:hypothetical protein
VEGLVHCIRQKEKEKKTKSENEMREESKMKRHEWLT